MEKFEFDLQEAAKLAKKYYAMDYHCSEAATRTLLEILHGKADQTLMKVSTSFMGGISGTEQQICGAASGALIVLGSIYGRSDPNINDDLLTKIGQEFLENFTNHCGANSLICHELRERRQVPSCSPYVQCAVVETLKLIQRYQNS